VKLIDDLLNRKSKHHGKYDEGVSALTDFAALLNVSYQFSKTIRTNMAKIY